MRIALAACLLLAPLGCTDPEPPDDEEDDFVPVDVEAILWCVPTRTSGETADGERVTIPNTGKDVGVCLCLPIGTQPTTGSELDQLLHQMALDQCEEDLAALGAVTTRCAEVIPERLVDYEQWCDPDEWPPPPQ